MRKSGTTSVLLILLASVLSAQGWRGSEVVGLQVNDAKGRPIAGARVTLTFQGTPGAIGPAIVATNTNGRAVLADLAPGPWQVEIHHPDYLSYVAMIDVRRGKKPLVSASFLEAGGRSLSPVRVKFSKGDPNQASPVLEARQPAAPIAVEPEPAPAAEAQRQAPVEQIVQAEPPAPQPEAPPTQPASVEPAEAAVGTSAIAESAAPEEPTPKAQEPIAPVEPAPKVAPQVDDEPALVETAPPTDDSPSPEEAPTSPPPAPSDPEPAAVPDLPEEIPEVVEPTAIEPLPTPEPEPTREASPSPATAEVPVSPEPSIEDTQTASDPATTPTAPVPAPIEEPEAPAPVPVTPDPVVLEEEPPAPESEARPETETVPLIPTAEPPTEEPLAPAPLPAEGALPVPPDPGIMVSSSRDGSCSDCQTAEWSLTTTAPVAAAAPGSPGSCGAEVMEAAHSAMEGLSNSIQLELASFIGPAADGSSRQAIDRVESDIAEPFQSSLATYVAGASPCQIVGVVIPKSLRFSRVRLSATDQQRTAECRPEQECPIGEARWVGSAQVARGHSATVIYGVFQNLATNRGRRAGLTVYFRPPNSNWRPRIPTGP